MLTFNHMHANQTELAVTGCGKGLHWSLDFPCESTGWTLLGSQQTHITNIAWLKTSGPELRDCCPTQFLKQWLADQNLASCGAFLTSACLEDYVLARQTSGLWTVRCVATVGLGNSLRIGDPGSYYSVGTINIATEISLPLTTEARMEAIGLVTEAKTLAMMEAGIRSYKSHRPATGTGTDCVLICSRMDATRAPYAGKHTLIGQLIGEAAYRAVSRGITKWKLRFPNSPLLGGP